MSDLGAVYAHIDSKPRSARLDFYLLTIQERALLRAMCGSTRRGEGESAWLPLEQYAVRAGMSRKTAQRLVQGWTDHRNGKRHVGLIARGILTELAPASWAEKRGAIYRVNWDAFQVDPNWVGIIERRLQQNLPGITRPTAPGEDASEPPDTGHCDHQSIRS